MGMHWYAVCIFNIGSAVHCIMFVLSFNFAQTGERQTANMLFAKLLSLHCVHLDFGGCNFAASHMVSDDAYVDN